MYESLLESIGLTHNESKVYLALLKLGKARTGDIVSSAKISGGKIYETLDKLKNKGLVKIVLENGIKHFIANNPDMIGEYLDEKEKDIKEKKQELSKALPYFNALKKAEPELDEVSLIKGMRGISSLVYQSLETGNSISIMGVSSSKNIKFNRFWMNWHRKRVELKKEARVLFSDKGTKYWKFFKGLKHTQVREILHFSPSAIMIIDNETFIFLYTEELTCIHIKSKPITASLLNFFNDLWKVA